MAEFTRTRPNENRLPEFIELPDGRKRLTRYYDFADADRIRDTMVVPYGTLDTGDTGSLTTTFANLRLVDQRFDRRSKDGSQPGSDPVYIMVYEELPATAEQQVGGNTLIQLEDGRTAVETNSLQFVAGVYVPGTVGTTTAPGDANAYLKSVEMTNDGTLRRIKRTFVYAGTISTDDQSLHNGKLLKKTIVSVKTIPPTPVGFTLVGSPVQSPLGLSVYSYTFYKGDGEISRDTDYFQSIDGGVTGGTRIEIQHLSAPTVLVTPIVTPVGFAIAKTGVREQDGYKLWSGVYAKGVGLVVSSTSIRNKGKLVLYHRVSLDAAPATPVPTIGGTVNLIESGTRVDSGFTVYDYRWAEGEGLVSTQLNDALDGRITYETKRAYGTPVAAAGEFETSETEDDGYTVYISRGITINSADLPDEVTTRNNGALVLTRKRKINVAPTGVGIGNLILDTADPAEGYTLYTRAWADGDGLVVDAADERVLGRLVLYHRVQYGAAPATPAATVGGTVTLTAFTEREDDGYTVHDYRWTEANGQADIVTEGQSDGAIDYNVTTFSVAAATPAYPGTGTAYMIRLRQTPSDGYFTNQAVYRKPPANTTQRKHVRWVKPGRIDIASPDPDFILVGQTSINVLASVAVSYSTIQETTAIYTVAQWASLRESYTIAATGQVVVRQEVLNGHLSGATGASGVGMYHGVDCDDFSYTIAASSPSSSPTGDTVIDVDNTPYLTATDGTVVYRRTVVTITL